ncbi:helix-turn-helix transcriptional regulator [Variovorax ginsengisoli]|uniref:AraC-like DNA-binding protein n=1 Tax=Variovorax ginsengisoli TaxID=363844 RepID=A0ABT9S3I5_9BURK|nr:AraC family transcriptional regulator [Variovorax ginsengisoli]MDP9898899.1 AraC-like DNA-binding protein [Variovorax ginsengisoli]
MDDRHPPSTIRRWSTDEVAPAQRLDYWVDAICEGFLEMEVSSPEAAAFSSSLVSAACGRVGVNRVSGCTQDVYRTPAAIARSTNSYFYLLCKTDTPWTTEQAGRSARLLPNDVVLVDSRRCYEFHFPVSADTISLQLPPDWLASWLVDPASQVAHRIDGQAGWGLALSSFARALSPESAAAAPLPHDVLSDQLGALLAMATQAAQPVLALPRASADALAGRIGDIVRQRHAEPGLTAADVARVLDLSPRTLHRALAHTGTTFAQCLMACRMAAARRMLADTRFDRLSIAEIGRRVGLVDASHFARVCRQQLGATPAVLRQRR